MQRVATSIPNPCIPWANALQQAQVADSERLASLAELTMSRQSPGLVLPSLGDAPTSFSHTDGSTTALSFARSLVRLGLGSEALWQRHNSNPGLFIRDSLNQWLTGLGADKLRDCVSIDFSVVDHVDSIDETTFDSQLFALLETSDGCGALFLGEVLRALQAHAPDLGRAFYIVLDIFMTRWIYTFDVDNAENFVERWKECAEMDMDGDSNETFEEYCVAHEISFPDPHASMPSFLKNISYRDEARRLKGSIALLSKHREGPFAALIEPLLTLTAIKQKKSTLDHFEAIRDAWDDQPMPNWIVAFESADPIMQAFDEESRTMNESSHAPTWIEAFDPADVKAVGRMLDYVKGFVEVNLQLAKIQRFAEKWSRSHASQRRTQLNNNLRAA
jgi:hypothetical protein